MPLYSRRVPQHRFRSWTTPPDGSWISFLSRLGRPVFFATREPAGAVLPHASIYAHPHAGQWRTGETATAYSPGSGKPIS
jgi:hypothetical protein